MMITILILMFISIISLIIVEDFEPLINLKNKLGLGFKRKIKSKYKFIDIILSIFHKLLNCAPCLSYHLTWLFFLIIGSYIGFIIGIFTYVITKLLYKYLWTTSIF